MGVRVTRPLCDCSHCQIDRDRGRRQYVAKWPDGDDYYGANFEWMKAPRALAMVFGVRHAARLTGRLKVLLVPGQYKGRMTLAKCRATWFWPPRI